jgi:uncharacterized RDD family membrane protein YckC
MTYASFMQRISGAMIDGVIFLFVASFFIRGHQNDPFLATSYFLVAVLFALIVVAFVSVRYSGTPGNLLLNCQIVDAQSGNSVSVKQAILRSMGIFLTISTFGIGFLWILVDKKRQALHDKLSNTIVVFSGTVDHFDESQKTLHQLISEVR